MASTGSSRRYRATSVATAKTPATNRCRRVRPVTLKRWKSPMTRHASVMLNYSRSFGGISTRRRPIVSFVTVAANTDLESFTTMTNRNRRLWRHWRRFKKTNLSKRRSAPKSLQQRSFIRPRNTTRIITSKTPSDISITASTAAATSASGSYGVSNPPNVVVGRTPWYFCGLRDKEPGTHTITVLAQYRFTPAL